MVRTSDSWLFFAEGGRPVRQPLALIATHDEWVSRPVESILTPHGYPVSKAATAAEAIERARLLAPDVLLVDAQLRGLPGIDLCRVVRSISEVPRSTPIMLLSRIPAAREERIAALRAGAWEMLPLPFDAEEFLLKLDTATAATRDAREAWQAGLVDPATGLYNARGIVWRVHELASEAARYHRPIACVALSPTSDVGADSPEERSAIAAAMPQIAAVLRRASRGSDVLGRMREREFLILAPNTSARGAVQLAERVAAAADASTALAVGADARIRLPAGCFGVSDFAAANMEPVELLTGAMRALRGPHEPPVAPSAT